MAPHQALVAVCLLPTVKAAKEVEIDVENLVKAEAQMLIYLFYAALFLYPVLRWSIKRYTSKIASMTQEYMDKMSSKISETKKANVSSSKRSGGKLSSSKLSSSKAAGPLMREVDRNRVPGRGGPALRFSNAMEKAKAVVLRNNCAFGSLSVTRSKPREVSTARDLIKDNNELARLRRKRRKSMRKRPGLQP